MAGWAGVRRSTFDVRRCRRRRPTPPNTTSPSHRHATHLIQPTRRAESDYNHVSAPRLPPTSTPRATTQLNRHPFAHPPPRRGRRPNLIGTPSPASRHVRRSTCDVRRSTFDVRRSTFEVRRSTFDVRRSTFDVRLWALRVQALFCFGRVRGGSCSDACLAWITASQSHGRHRGNHRGR